MQPDNPPPRAMHWRRGLAFVLLAVLTGGAYVLYSGAWTPPERFNLWSPLDVMAAPGPLTGYKLSRATGDPALCREALAQTGMRYEPLPDRVTGPGCGFDNAVQLRTANIKFGAPLTLSCPLALSFFMWEKHTLQPAAEKHFGQPVAAVEHLGSYACRNINRGEGAAPGRPDTSADTSAGARSRHATANALDIAAFILADGRRISVLRQWPHEDAATNATDPRATAEPAALLLKDAHDGACRFFRGVLGPDYNAVHRDHFHLETGGYRMCR